MEEISRNPGCMTTEYYKTLGMNAYQGNRSRKQLEEYGLICGKELPLSGNGRAGRTLELTEKAYQILKLTRDNRHGGAIHKSMIRMIAKKFEGRRVDIEKPLGDGKATDIVIDGKIAIEVETRNFSDSNIKKNLSAGYERVVLVCGDTLQVIKFGEKVYQNFFFDLKKITVLDFRTIMAQPDLVFGEKKN